MVTVTDLIGYQRAQFARASTYRSRQVLLQFAVAVPGALSVFTDNGILLYLLASLGGILLGAYWWTDHRYRSLREAAERARRATLLIGGLGVALSAAEEFQLAQSFEVDKAEAAAHGKDGYFASEEGTGPKRLAEMLEESAFWTEHLHKASFIFMLGACVILLGAFLFIGWWAIPFGTTTAQMALARVFLAILVFVLSSDVWGAAYAHFSGWTEVKEIRLRLAAARDRGAEQGDVLLLMSDYNAAVEAAPLIVPKVYEWRGDKLNELWRDYQNARTAANVAADKQQ